MKHSTFNNDGVWAGATVAKEVEVKRHTLERKQIIIYLDIFC